MKCNIQFYFGMSMNASLRRQHFFLKSKHNFVNKYMEEFHKKVNNKNNLKYMWISKEICGHINFSR